MTSHWPRCSSCTECTLLCGTISSTTTSRLSALSQDLFSNPVSYTHLDVYKRQVQQCLLIFSWVVIVIQSHFPPASSFWALACSTDFRCPTPFLYAVAKMKLLYFVKDFINAKIPLEVPSCISFKTNWILPVSYTHLEVYKRQELKCECLILANYRAHIPWVILIFDNRIF